MKWRGLFCFIWGHQGRLHWEDFFCAKTFVLSGQILPVLLNQRCSVFLQSAWLAQQCLLNLHHYELEVHSQYVSVESCMVTPINDAFEKQEVRQSIFLALMLKVKSYHRINWNYLLLPCSKLEENFPAITVNLTVQVLWEIEGCHSPHGVYRHPLSKQERKSPLPDVTISYPPANRP